MSGQQLQQIVQTNPQARDLIAQIQQQSLGAFPQSVQNSPYVVPYAVNTIPGDWAAMTAQSLKQSAAPALSPPQGAMIGPFGKRPGLFGMR